VQIFVADFHNKEFPTETQVHFEFTVSFPQITAPTRFYHPYIPYSALTLQMVLCTKTKAVRIYRKKARVEVASALNKHEAKMHGQMDV
jgi:hypothetical protein